MRRLAIKKVVLSIVLGFGFLLFSGAYGYSQSNFSKYARLFILDDKGELKQIIKNAKKNYQKNPENKDALIKLGIAYHNLGDLGDKDAPDEAVKYLKEAHERYPKDSLALAVLGSSTTMLGRYSKKKISEGRVLSSKGGDLLDKAVALAPDDVLVRMVRAGNSKGQPKFFGRRHFYKGDTTHVKDIMEKSPQGEFPNDFKALIYYQLGDAYKLEKDETQAVAYFKKAIKADPNSRWAKMAKKEL